MMMIAALSFAVVSAMEAWPAVVGAGLIPVIGLIAVGYLIIHSVRDSDEVDHGGGDRSDPPPP